MFPFVAVEMSGGFVLYYATQEPLPGWQDLGRESDPNMLGWMEALSRDVSVNRLDNLVMNRHKFTVLGDSTFERLREKYAVLSKAR